MTGLCRTAAVVALLLGGALPVGPAPALAAKAGAVAVPAQPSAQLDQIASMLVGSWKTTAPVAQTGGEAGATADVAMHIAKVEIPEIPNALYIELARADAMWKPYRQAIFQVYDYKGKPRLRTYEFRNNPGMTPSLTGMWLAPEAFPKITRNDLIATLDVELAPKGKGFAGKTPYPYPTGVGGAVEMTSEIEITPEQIVSIDRGIGADGKVVWGSGEGMKYTFAKFDPGLEAKRLEGGLVVIDFVHPEGREVKEGDKVTVHYSGWLADGTQFDSSRQEGREPFTYDWPGSLIKGWNDGTAGMTKGTIRRLIIPSELGYGDRGAGRGRIPPNATLFFELEALAIQTPEAPAADPMMPTDAQPGATPEQPKPPVPGSEPKPGSDPAGPRPKPESPK